MIVGIAGYSGHGLVVAESAISSGIDVRYYLEKFPAVTNPLGLVHGGFEGDEMFFSESRIEAFILGIGDNKIRSKLFSIFEKNHKHVLTVIDPSAQVSKFSKIGQGAYIGKLASVNILAEVEKGCIINTGAIVEHETKIGEFTHVAPGAVIAGGVSIGSYSFIGANAVIKNGVSIGNNVIIGAGCVVVSNFPDNTIIVGNPGREMRRK